MFHEVWGLVEHTRDVCKRVGKLGFASMAPNLYVGYDGILVPDKIQKAMESVWDLSLEERRDKTKVAQAMDRKRVSKDIREVVSVIYDPAFRDRLLEHAMSTVEEAYAKFGAVTTLGFCMGGGLALKCATKTTHLRSAIGFYGEPPSSDLVDKISVPVLTVYANHDEIINSKAPAFVGAMLNGGQDLTLKTYPRTEHGFFNDTRKDVYDRRAAVEAWDLTRWFLERTLGRR